MLKPVLTSLMLDPAAGERRGDVLIIARFPAVAFADSKPHEIADTCADQVRASVLHWAHDNGRRPEETVEQFVERIRRGAVRDAHLSIEQDAFVAVEPVQEVS